MNLVFLQAPECVFLSNLYYQNNGECPVKDEPSVFIVNAEVCLVFIRYCMKPNSI